MPSTLAINPFINRDPPILYGSLSFERAFEDFPSCVLQVDFILHKDLDKYINEYAKYGREYTIFGSVFIVESYDVQAIQLPNPASAGQILSYSLRITYQSCIKAYGQSVVVEDINVPVRSLGTSTISYTTLVNKTPLRTNANFEVKLSEFEEYKNTRRYDLMSLAASYSRLYGNYVDYNTSNYILFKNLNEGRLIVFNSSLVYQIQEYDTAKSSPVLLKSCYSPPLYETLELFYNSKSTEIPKYTPEPLVTQIVCNNTYSKNPTIYNHTYFNYFGATIRQIDTYHYPSQMQMRCQAFVGKNLTAEVFFEYEDEISSPMNITLVKYLLYTYKPLNYSLPNITVKSYIGDRVEDIPLTIVNTHSVIPRYLAQIKGFILKGERLVKVGLNKRDDTLFMEQELRKAEIELRKARIDFERIKSDVSSDYEKVLSAQLKVYQAQHEVYKKERELALLDYYFIIGSTGTTYDVEPYNIRKSDWVAGSIVREKPEVFGIPALVDSNGYAYYVLTDPNWRPPYYVNQEFTFEYFPYESFIPSDYLDAVFRKIIYREYLQARINFLTRGEEKLIEPKSYLNLRPDYFPEYPEDRTYGTDDYDDINSEILELQYEQMRIDAEKMPDKLVLGGYSNTLIKRIPTPYKQQVVNPITGDLKHTYADKYEEVITETVGTYQTKGNLQKTTSSTILGKPPEPTYWEQNYVPIDPKLKREPQYIYEITSADWNIYSYLGNLTYYARRYEDLPSYPTTAFTKYIKALVTETSIEEMKTYSIINLELIGLFYDIMPGDYIKINDIPELAAGDYRVISVSFEIEFSGYTPENTPLAVCNSTKLTLGKYRTKQYTWRKKPLPKQGDTQYEVSNEVSSDGYTPKLNSNGIFSGFRVGTHNGRLTRVSWDINLLHNQENR